MRYSKYPHYQNTKSQWLGEIPSHWNSPQGRRVFQQRKQSLVDGDDQLSATQKYGVIPQKLFMELEDQKVTLALAGTGNFKHVEKDDFVISLRSFQGGIERSQYIGCVSPAYTVLKPAMDVDSGYMAYVLKSEAYIAELQSVTDGIREGKNISYEQFGRIELPYPPIDEQKKIANFLDTQINKLDDLIGKQNRLLVLLREKRHALISGAVTKGINTGRKMKASSLKWLGDIPSSWNVVPFRLAVDFQEGPGIMASDFRDEGTPLLRVASIKGRFATLDGCNFLDPKKVASKWSHFMLKAGDLLISASATMGTVTEVNEDTAGAIAYTGIIKLAPKKGLTKEFLTLIVISEIFLQQIEQLKTGATIQHFGPTHLSQMKIVLPPIDEQIEITSYLEKSLGRLNLLEEKCKESIALLIEHRSSLVASAITGKIDVRDL